MSFKGKVCTEGLWDESIPGIEFDENGVSNYAKLFHTLEEAYPRGETGLKEWNKIIEKIKNDGKGKRYDCIIGVSGGTDSSYLLHVAKEYNLRPLAVGVDNGFNTEISDKNAKLMTSKLNIDLEIFTVDKDEISDLLHSYMLAELPWIDIPSDLAIKSALYKIAKREGIKYILRGNDFRSEGSQPEEWTYGDGRQLLAIHKKFGKIKLNNFPNYTLSNVLYYGFIKKIKSIYPFYYLDYNKTKAQAFLAEKYGWEYYGGHHHENIFTKFALTYWLYEKFGIDKRKITYSAQILSKEISRDYAVNEINKKPYNDSEIKELIGVVLNKLGITQDEFDHIMNQKNKTFHDYPSYSFILSKLTKIANPILKLVFIHKPQSMFQAEMRNQKK